MYTIAQQGEKPLDSCIQPRRRTVRENLDDRIQYHRNELAKLEELKSQLISSASLLDVDIDSLRSAMQY